ncbi:unnamed protein product [Pieris brassicae]|uniref:Cyclic nucleotide-binding domain-containing protein n=1 Tax=Pieris brassicae TaxID=7116 RepID=A0A9P0XC51_PIEBR|nr:unnamed protein product [Pieris brassicae]
MEDTLVFMYERALREVPLFGKVERSFIRVITQHLHEMYFLKGDTVVQCKDIQTNIYIIYKGKVDVLSSYNEMITCMGTGGMFGNFTGQPLSSSEVAIYASRSLDLLVIPSQTFFNLIKYYPKIQGPLRRAFEVSKDYILPISMENEDDESSEDSDYENLSQESGFDSRSGSSRFDFPDCHDNIHSCSSYTHVHLSMAIDVNGNFTYKFDTDTPQRRWDYTTSFYVVVSELTSTGGDEFVVNGAISMIILAICFISGKILAAIVIATSIQIAYSSKYALNKYEKATTELIDYLTNQGLSTYQIQKFWTYVRQLWVTERGRQLPVLILKTPYVLRCDLMSAMFGHHLRNCYIFADTGEPFLRQLTVVLDYKVYFPGNYIVVAGDSEARMHWVTSGTVAVLSVKADLTETTHEILCIGDVFGILQGLNRGITHCFSYRAETKVGILTLCLDSWINILPFFPDAQRRITERSEVLFTQI